MALTPTAGEARLSVVLLECAGFTHEPPTRQLLLGPPPGQRCGSGPGERAKVWGGHVGTSHHLPAGGPQATQITPALSSSFQSWKMGSPTSALDD